MDNWTELQNELSKYLGTLVYNVDGKITKLIDVIDEPDDDYFWVMEQIDGSRTALSCVCSPEFLIESLSAEEYRDLEAAWNNGQGVIKKMQQQVEK